MYSKCLHSHIMHNARIKILKIYGNLMFIMHKTFMISCKLRIVQKTVYIDAQFHSKLCTKSYANAEN